LRYNPSIAAGSPLLRNELIAQSDWSRFSFCRKVYWRVDLISSVYPKWNKKLLY